VTYQLTGYEGLHNKRPTNQPQLSLRRTILNIAYALASRSRRATRPVMKAFLACVVQVSGRISSLTLGRQSHSPDWTAHLAAEP
jgi:hypothetical protein